MESIISASLVEITSQILMLVQQVMSIQNRLCPSLYSFLVSEIESFLSSFLDWLGRLSESGSALDPASCAGIVLETLAKLKELPVSNVKYLQGRIMESMILLKDAKREVDESKEESSAEFEDDDFFGDESSCAPLLVVTCVSKLLALTNSLVKQLYLFSIKIHWKEHDWTFLENAINLSTAISSSCDELLESTLYSFQSLEQIDQSISDYSTLFAQLTALMESNTLFLSFEFKSKDSAALLSGSQVTCLKSVC
jgi:hypothetical protein